MSLPAKIPSPYLETNDRSPQWRVGALFVWGTGFSPPCWIHERARISIRPNETGEEAFERETGEKLRPNEFIFWNNF